LLFAAGESHAYPHSGPLPCPLPRGQKSAQAARVYRRPIPLTLFNLGSSSPQIKVFRNLTLLEAATAIPMTQALGLPRPYLQDWVVSSLPGRRLGDPVVILPLCSGAWGS
jgi:hypothetical protein